MVLLIAATLAGFVVTVDKVCGILVAVAVPIESLEVLTRGYVRMVPAGALVWLDGIFDRLPFFVAVSVAEDELEEVDAILATVWFDGAMPVLVLLTKALCFLAAELVELIALLIIVCSCMTLKLRTGICVQ